MSCDPSANGFTTQTDYVRDQSGNQLSRFAPDANGNIVLDYTNVWANGTLMATYDGGNLHFYLNDWLGTRRVQTDYSGVVEQDCASLPYGDAETCQPTPAENLFTGKERDAESGLDHFKYRYYASSLGRWLSPDPSGLTHADLGNPQSFNLYSYVGNRPLTFADHEGLCWKGFQWACHIVQRFKNLAAGDGFRTDKENTLRPGKASQREREESYIRETQGLGSAPHESLVKLVVCSEFSDAQTLSGLTHRTAGVGVGGSGGAGIGLDGGYLSFSADEVADPHGNVGIAINGGFGPFVLGLGAQGGGQVLLSNAKSINDLHGDATDHSGSAGWFGLDVSNAKGGPTSVTATFGPGFGTRATTSLGESHTWAPFSINCK